MSHLVENEYFRFILEKFIWLSVPIIFLLITLILLRFFSKKIPIWPFYFLTLLSVSSYLLAPPRCASMEFQQFVCTAKISLEFNIEFFLYGYLVIFVLEVIRKYISIKNNRVHK